MVIFGKVGVGVVFAQVRCASGETCSWWVRERALEWTLSDLFGSCACGLEQ